MMSEAGEFTIYEIPVGGQPGEGEVFVWTSDRSPKRPDLGGARAAPVGGWEMTAKHRGVRTDYPGAYVPSKQMLGGKHEPFTWSGVWDDRYNFPGYAVKERKRAEQVLWRGNVIKIGFQDEEFYAFVDELKVVRLRDWQIRYILTVDPQCRTDNSEIKRSPVAQTNPVDVVDAVDSVMAAVADVHTERPGSALVGTNTNAVTALLNRASEGLAVLQDKLNTKTGVLSPIGDFRTMSGQMRSLEGQLSETIASLVQARSDVDVGVRNARDVLAFEDWTRNTRTLLRMARNETHRGAEGMAERDVAKAQAYYRPMAGESLYSVSRKAYGTPYRTNDIIVANNLTTMVFDGTELLMIPQGGIT